MSQLDLVDKGALEDAIDFVKQALERARQAQHAAESAVGDCSTTLAKLQAIKRRVREADISREGRDSRPPSEWPDAAGDQVEMANRLLNAIRTEVEAGALGDEEHDPARFDCLDAVRAVRDGKLPS